MTQCINDANLKFTLALYPFYGSTIESESLWGHWIDKEKGLVSSRNNAFHVPLAVYDTVRVALNDSGAWQVVEIVRLAESVVTTTEFGPPVTVPQALAVYDGWVHDGKAVYTEGPGTRFMVTTWREFLPVEEVLGALSQCTGPGWEIWEILTPHQRLEALEEGVDMSIGRL